MIEAWFEFQAPSGGSYRVPAFYDGDGSGGMEGSLWKVRFTPDEIGDWAYESQSAEDSLSNVQGEFQVVPPPDCPAYQPGDLPQFECLGRLRHQGGPYLSFSNGTTWLKGGVDDPEDFMAPSQSAGLASKQAAIDYLAELGINSMYLMVNNVGGDERNVWPWLGQTEAEAMRQHELFDLDKLDEWEDIFQYIQAKGIVLHIVLEDDSGWTGFNRELYYREMVARFGHHNGLIWNLSEEFNENYTPDQIKQFASLLSDLDPYGHPITVHNAGELRSWAPFLADPNITVSSFQTGKEPQNQQASAWRESASRIGPGTVLSFDETGRISSRERDLSRHILWSVYLGGANFELHTAPLRSYLDFTGHFEDIQRARSFLEGYPFCTMEPANHLVLDGQAYLLAAPGMSYVAYLPAGGQLTLELSDAVENLRTAWFNPRSGEVSEEFILSGREQASLRPPFEGDAVLGVAITGLDLGSCLG